jgi:hypothetical protein
MFKVIGATMLVIGTTIGAGMLALPSGFINITDLSCCHVLVYVNSLFLRD